MARVIETGAPDFEDDSIAFAQRERDHVGRRFVPDLSGSSSTLPSPGNLLPLPLSTSRVALIGTAGAHGAAEAPMSPRGELRVVLLDADDIVLSHPGYDTERASDDPEVVFPLQTLQMLAGEGFIGSVAPNALSTMGFIPDGRRVIERLVPELLSELGKEHVALALLVPA